MIPFRCEEVIICDMSVVGKYICKYRKRGGYIIEKFMEIRMSHPIRPIRSSVDYHFPQNCTSLI